MSEDPSKDAAVIVPLALTDFAKALRELIGAFRDIAGLTNDGVSLVRRRNAAQSARDLDELGFPPNGMFRPLSRIASGRNIPQDFDLLDQLIGDTAEPVARSVQSLRNYRKVIRESCGLAAATRLDKLLDGPSGKFEIRYAIGALTYNYRNGWKRDELASQADQILKMIDRFNLDLIELHDLVFPPRGAPR